MFTQHTKRGLAAAVVAFAMVGFAGCGQSAATSSSSAAGGASSGAKASGSSSASSTAKDKDTIVFAAVPSEASQSLKDQYGNVVKLIEKETGKKVTYQDATDYSAVIEGQRAGKIDIAMYGPFSYKIAKDSGVPIEPLAAGVNKKGDKPGYYSTAWTQPSTGIKSLNDLKGKKVCFVDPASTSGNLVPTAGLKKVGLDPTKDMTQIFAGAHDASMISTSTGQCDAGFAQDSQVPTMITKGQLKDGQLTQIWKSDMIPGSPVAMNTKTLSTDLQTKLKDIFANKANVDDMTQAGICTSAADCKMAGDAKWGYIAVDDKFYDPVRDICTQTQAAACKAS